MPLRRRKKLPDRPRQPLGPASAPNYFCALDLCMTPCIVADGSED